MDITVRRTGAERSWSSETCSGDRWAPLGIPAREVPIHPKGNATETMHGLRPGPYASLDAALAEIETHTQGVCRMDEDHGQ